MRLWTVQHRAVLGPLEDIGELVGDWARVMSPSFRPAYEEMVAEMARRGIDCAGRPPLWAWPGPDTRDDRVALTAEMLLNPEGPEEYDRYVVLDLDVPDESVVLSSYGRWNDFLEAVFMGGSPPSMDWSIDQDELDGPTYARVQACFPRLAGPWVLGVRPLEPSSDEPEEAPCVVEAGE
ncbi:MULTISPECIES: DUF3841 domain-containing protein [Streptosporangium]|uniref:Uncharacterized protein n=1 Tax=Streptosporangium brasiliense TaxID=47480 RepID=A0ABT9RKF7_9ACTN|nr:DUF3841 domain-containing protein [Streptosporangium brasiliense]MDP9869573.1 hypothetical protein [Streptosporangium brasiliense]